MLDLPDPHVGMILTTTTTTTNHHQQQQQQAYELVEPMFLELGGKGIAHMVDYAFTPVLNHHQQLHQQQLRWHEEKLLLPKFASKQLP